MHYLVPQKITTVVCVLASLLAGCDGIVFDEVTSPTDTASNAAPPDGDSRTPVDLAAQNASDTAALSVVTDSDTQGNSAAASEIDSMPGDNSETAALLPTPSARATGDDCVAPLREEFMARYGVTAEDKDLSDPNVLTARAHTILFIFDKSGSMSSAWNEDDGTKWEIARDTMIAAVSPFQQYLSAGAVFFSLEDEQGNMARIDSGLQINYADGATFLDVWDENMGAYEASGGTPLMDALETADDAIAVACGEGLLDWPFKVMLITDGMPSYWDANRGLELIKDWYDRGIPTTVVGMPGSNEATRILSDIAAVGSGGEIQIDGTVDETTASAEEIVYTQQSTAEDFEEDMLIALE